MSGTIDGGNAAAAMNKQLYGKDFYQRIESIGGLKSQGGGFTGNHERAVLAGKIGGRSRRKGTLTIEQFADIQNSKNN